MTSRDTAPLAVAFALGIVYVVWGSTYLAIGVVVETMPSLLSAGLRFLLAGLLMGVLLSLVRVPAGGPQGMRRLAVSGRQLGGAALLGLLLPAGATAWSASPRRTALPPVSRRCSWPPFRCTWWSTAASPAIGRPR